MKLIIAIFALVLAIAPAMGISVSASDNQGAITTSYSLAGDSSLRDSTSLSEEGIYREMAVSGPAQIDLAASGGSQNFRASIAGPDIESSLAAGKGGVGGKVDVDGNEIFTEQDVAHLATNPDAFIGIGQATVKGSTIQAMGGNYPRDGSFDPTQPWYIDPAVDTKFTMSTQGRIDVLDPRNPFGSNYIDMTRFKNELVVSGNTWNGQIGKPIFDGVKTSSSLKLDFYDYTNTVMIIPAFAMRNAWAQTRIAGIGRVVKDVDTAYSDIIASPTGGNPAIFSMVTLHEMGEGLGLKHDPYYNTVMNPYPKNNILGNSAYWAWLKYNN
jgi:hypothetical protein